MLRILVERFSVYICQAFCTCFFKQNAQYLSLKYWGRTFGRNWDKSLKSFPPCNSQSPPTNRFYPPPPLPPPPSKNGLELVCNVNMVSWSFKSENSQYYAQRPQRNFTFVNSALKYWTTLGRGQGGLEYSLLRSAILNFSAGLFLILVFIFKGTIA
jgi:hypothetical protein